MKKTGLFLAVIMFLTSILGTGVTANAQETVSENAAVQVISENALTADGEATELEAEKEAMEETKEASDELQMENFAVSSPSGMKIYGIYLGEDRGDSVLVESNGEYLLMDIGSTSAYPYVKALLDSLGVTHLSLYFSHTHADHTGGLKAGEAYDQLTSDFKIDNLYLPDEEKIIPASLYKAGLDHAWNYQQFENLLTQNQKSRFNIEVNKTKMIHYLSKGSSFTFGNVKVDVIGPVNTNKLTAPKNIDGDDDNDDGALGDFVNNCSLISMLTCGNRSFLTTGDCQDEEEELLAAYYKNELKADVYKLSHHAYASGNTADFMKYVQPMYSFAESTKSTDLRTDSNGMQYRVTRKARQIAQNYGICYLTGDEKETIMYDVQSDKITMHRMGQALSPVQGTALNGWVKLFGADGVYELYDSYYLGSDGKPLTGIQEIDEKKYYFGTGGCLEKGRYVKSGSKVTYTGWVKYTVGKNYFMRYYEEKTGEMYTGFQKLSGVTYYFNPETGYRSSGIQKVNGKYYMFGNGGDMKTSKWFFDTDKNKHYAGKDGALYVGFKKISGQRYYFDETSALVVGTAKNPICEIKGKYYYVTKTGKILGNRTYKAGKKTYKFNKSGVMTNPPKISKTAVSKVTAGSGNLKVSWKRNKKVDGYEVYIATEKNGAYTKAKTIKKNKTVSAKISKLTSGQTYYVKIRSVKKVNGITFYSKYSSAKEVTVS